MNMPRFLSLIALTVITLLAAWPTSAVAGLEVEAQVGFDGFYVPGEWVPIEILLSNMPAPTDRRAPENLEGVISVISPSRGGRPHVFTMEVDLPANSRKRIWMAIKASEPEEMAPPVIQVEYRATNRRARATTDVQGRIPPPDSALVVIVRDPGRPESLRLPGVTGSQSYTIASVTRLPDRWETLSGVAAIFLTRSSAVHLGEGEVEALRLWVEQGGTLLVDGGGGEALAAAPIADLLPVDTGGRSAWILETGNRFIPHEVGGDGIPDNAAVLQAATLRPGAQALWRGTGDRILAASRPLGLGRVAHVAWDLSSPAMAENPRAMAAISALLPAPGEQMLHDLFHQQMLNDINPDPDVRAPSVFLVLILLVAYFVVVGPGNYLYLSRRKRIELSWITLPILIVGFCLLIYGIGYLARRNTDSLRHINIVRLQPGVSTARIDGLSVHFSATKQRVSYEPNLPGSTLNQISLWRRTEIALLSSPGWVRRRGVATPGYGMTQTAVEALGEISEPASVHMTRDRMSLEDQRLRQWSFAYLETMGTVDIGGTLEADCDLSLTEGESAVRIRGSVTNRTDYDLTHCAIIWGDRICDLATAGGSSAGELHPGETLTFDAPWNAGFQGVGFRDRSAYLSRIQQDDPTNSRRASLDAHLRTDLIVNWLNARLGRPVFVAFSTRAPLAPEPDRAVERETDCSLILLDLPLDVTKPTRFHIDSPRLPVVYSENAADDNAINVNPGWGNQPMVEMRDGRLLVTYRLPFDPSVNTQIEGLSAQIQFVDSENQWIRLFALDRSGVGGDPFIEIPTHRREEGYLMPDGNPVWTAIPGVTQPLDPRRMVDPVTGEVTLLIDSSPRPGQENVVIGAYAQVTNLTLSVVGRAWPPDESTASNTNEEVIQ